MDDLLYEEEKEYFTNQYEWNGISYDKDSYFKIKEEQFERSESNLVTDFSNDTEEFLLQGKIALRYDREQILSILK